MQLERLVFTWAISECASKDVHYCGTTANSVTKRNSLIRILSVTFILAGVAVGALLWETQNSGSMLKPNNPEVLAAGTQIYAEQCASCHGQKLEGQPNWQRRQPSGKLPAPPHDANGHTWHHNDELLFSITKYGIAKSAGLDGYDSDMPIYEGVLTDAEIIAVLSYIKSTWPEEIRERHDAMNKQ